jgi:AraC-like DNA-binding protein
MIGGDARQKESLQAFAAPAGSSRNSRVIFEQRDGEGGKRLGSDWQERHSRMRQALTVLSVWPRTIVADLRGHGRNVDSILDEAGLDLRTVNREGGRIPWQAQAKLIDIAARELGDDCYGIHLVAKVDVHDADALAYVGLASHTLGDALANIARYVKVFNEAVEFDLSAEDGVTVLGVSGVDPSFTHHGQQVEFGTALLLHLYRFLAKRQITPVEVHFVHGREHGQREVSHYFGCRVRYLQNRVGIVFRATDMATLIDTSDYRLLKILTVHCEGILKEHAVRHAGILQKVERRIIDLLPKGSAKAKVIAADLGVSERTLARQLAALGTSFNEVLDQIRKQLALKYVKETDLRLAQVAFLLGYANPPAFSLAFKRWTGRAPMELRQK